LHYIGDLATSPEYSGGYDCLHIHGILTALAGLSNVTVQAFLFRHPNVSKQGHRFTVALCTGVNSALNGARKAVTELAATARKKTISQYERALVESIAAIIEGDSIRLTASLTDMLATHSQRKDTADGLSGLWCMQAHGLFNLAVQNFIKRGLEATPACPVGIWWDQPFHEAALAHPDVPTYLEPFRPVSAKLANWCETLPASIHADEFVTL
jgi:hypothetical protein